MANQTFNGTAGGAALTINHPSSATVSDSALDLHVTAAPNSGRLLQFFADTITSNPIAYFDDGGNFYSRLSATVSGTFAGANISQPTSQPYMIGGWGDIDGPVYVSRWASLTTINARHFDFMSSDAAGSIFELTIKKKGVLAWGVGTTVNTWDTFLGRGNAAATLQLGGSDSFSPIAQTLAAQNVVASTTNLVPTASAAGQATIDQLGNPFPDNIFVGQHITDSTTPGAIPANTSVVSIAADRTHMTLSANLTGGGVMANDTLVFTSVDAPGADLIIASSRGTGAGNGGRICVKASPAGSPGSSQNPLQDILIVNPASSTGAGGVVEILGGGNSVPQLTFVPNSGVSMSLGMANGGSALGVFFGPTLQYAWTGSYFSIGAGLSVRWTNAVNNPFGTPDVGLFRSSAGELRVIGTSATSSGNLRAGSVRGDAVTFANLPPAPVEGMLVSVTDSAVNTWGATIAGGGANHVLAYYNGSNWTVAAR